jgi:predicted TIM-barrel fold metal-dependent hydrolase
MERRKALRIDCHAHVFGPDLPVVPGAWTVPDYAFTPEALLAQMDAFGVKKATLSGLSITGSNNNYLLEALKAHPDRLRGTAIIDPPGDLQAMKQMAQSGICGIRLQLARAPGLPDLSSPDWRTLLQHVRALGWHVQLAIEGDRLALMLAQLLAAEVKVVIDHFGHPDPAGPLNCPGLAAVLAAVDSGRVWVKLSGGFRLAGTASWQDPEADLWGVADTVAPVLLERVGTDRLLWGSDAPFVGYEKRLSYSEVLESYHRWVPDPMQRAEIDATGLHFYFG